MNYNWENLKDKILLHYNIVNTDDQSKQTIDQIVDPNLYMQIVNADGEIELIFAKDAKGKRACLPLSLDATNDIDKFYVKAGYAWTMPTNPDKGRQIKLPKKEYELRELFDFGDPKKASYWTNEFDDFFRELNFRNFTEPEFRSFTRGLFSCRSRIKPGANGYIVFCWEKFQYLMDYNHGDADFINAMCERIDCVSEYNCSNIFLQSREQIYNYINNIGFVQTHKAEAAIQLYRSRVRIVNDVVPVTKENYLLYHVQNYGLPEYYTEQLAIDFNVNARHPKNKRSPLFIALGYAKHSSYYPAIWLLNHGVDTKIVKSKKIIDSIYIDHNKQDHYYYTEFFPLIWSIIYEKQEYTVKIANLIFWNWKSSKLDEIFDNALKTGKLDRDTILETIVGKKKYTINGGLKYDTHTRVLNKIIDYSNENLTGITQKVINEMVSIIETNENIEYNTTWKRSSEKEPGFFYITAYDLYVPLLDCLLERLDKKDFKKDLQHLQNLMAKSNIIVYRSNGVIQHII